MNRRLALAFLAATALLQLGAPVSMILRRERVIREGIECRFDAAPVDPFDAFRGRYVAINLASNRAPVRADSAYRRGERVYASIATNSRGRAVFASISRTRPARPPWIRTRILYVDGPDNAAVIDTTLHRFYMEESEAPKAETAVNRVARRGATNEAVVVARVLNGMAIPVDIELDGVPIRQAIRD